MRAALEQRSIAAVFGGTEWLPAEQIGRRRDPNARNPHATASRWRAERKVFALSKGGVQFFPRYAFDETLDPRPVVAQVMAVLDGYSPYRLASWFESTNSYLGGRRPRELLQASPDAVIAAAREHVRGPVHRGLGGVGRARRLHHSQSIRKGLDIDLSIDLCDQAGHSLTRTSDAARA